MSYYARAAYAAFFAAVAAALIGTLAPGASLFVAQIELKTLDWRFLLRGPRPPHPDIVIVAIDEESLARVGRWPWPRRKIAELVDAIAAAGPKCIAFDIFFVEPSTQADDEALARAISRAGNVVMPLFVGEGANFSAPEVQRLLDWWQSLVPPPERLPRWRAASATAPLPSLAAGAAALGLADVVDSGDGVYRHVPLVADIAGRAVPSLSLAVARQALGPTAQIAPARGGLKIGRHIIPCAPDGLMLINFAGPRGTYPRVPAWKVLEAQAPELSGKVVLVGATAPGLHDLRPSPFGAVFDGVETQANAIASVLSGQALRELSPAVALLACIAAGAAVAAAVAWLPAGWAALACALAIAAWWNVALWLFAARGAVAPVALPTLSALAALAAGLATRAYTAERRERKVVEAFSRFVPPQVVQELVDEDLAEAERGQRRVITALFADIRGSSRYVQELAPEDFVLGLNRFFDEMHQIVWRHGGTLDKFIGDGLLCFFNAPADQPDHALRAVRAAIEMVETVRQMREVFDFFGLRELSIGVGINTGPAIVGYIGSSDRTQYTAVGPSVHLAARLQELTRDLGVDALMSEATYKLVCDAVEAEDLGEHQVRGFAKPVRVYRLLAVKGERE